jgi:hypothetical protein
MNHRIDPGENETYIVQPQRILDPARKQEKFKNTLPPLERVRLRIFTGLLVALIVAIVIYSGCLVLPMFFPVNDTSDHINEFSAAIITPLFTLVAGSAGYYFGSQIDGKRVNDSTSAE